MARKRVWRVVVCSDCHEDVIRFYRRDGRMKYGYSSRAHYLHPDVAPEGVRHDKVWVGFDVEDDMASGPEWLDIVCKCHARAGTAARVELSEAFTAVRDAPGRSVPLGDIAHPR